MVRFHWQVDESCTAFVPVGGLSSPSEDVQHFTISLEVPGVAGYASAILTCPPGLANGADSVPTRTVGVVLAHDADASTWKGELLSSVAQVCGKYLIYSVHTRSSQSKLPDPSSSTSSCISSARSLEDCG